MTECAGRASADAGRVPVHGRLSMQNQGRLRHVATGAHRADIRRSAHSGVRRRVQVLVFAEAEVGDLEDGRWALARSRLLQLDQRVLELQITMCEALVMNELHPCKAGSHVRSIAPALWWPSEDGWEHILAADVLLSRATEVGFRRTCDELLEEETSHVLIKPSSGLDPLKELPTSGKFQDDAQMLIREEHLHVGMIIRSERGRVRLLMLPVVGDT